VKVAVAVIASILAIVGNVSYVKSTLRGQTKPHPYSWFIWTIVSLTTFFGGVQKGAGVGAIPTGISELGTVIVFVISLYRLIKGRDVEQINKTIDTVFLVVALLGLVPWILTKDPTISVVTVVTIDLLAFIPTLRKTWAHPETENPLLYATNVCRHVLTLIALAAYNVATMLHSISMICSNTLMVILIGVRRRVAARRFPNHRRAPRSTTHVTRQRRRTPITAGRPCSSRARWTRRAGISCALRKTRMRTIV
jgi:hypothetical protein